MKKSLSVVLAAALAFGSFGSLAYGAELTAQEKYEALKAKGIFAGINGEAALDQNMTRAQFARVAALILEVDGIGNPDTKSVTVKPFPDVALGAWYTEEIAAIKENGAMVGNANGKFAPNANITVQELAVALAKALKLSPVADATVDGAANWAAGYIEALGNNGIVLPTNYKENATRALLVTAAHAADAVLNAPATASSVTVTATGAKKLTATFNAAVDTAKAKITVWNGANQVNSKSVTFAEDKKSAVIEFNNNLAAAVYTIKVEGLTETAITATVTVTASKVTKITFASEKLVIDRGDSTQANISYKVFNQYDEDVTSTNQVQVTSSKGTVAPTDSDGKITVTNAGGFTLDEKVMVTALHPGTSTFASTTASVALPSRVNTIDIVSLEHAAGKVLQQGATASDFKLLLDLKDQYGNSVTETTYLGNDVAISEAGTSVTFGTITKIDGKLYLPITAINGIVAGSTTVTIVSLTSGNKDSFEVVVKEAAKVDTLTLTVPTVAPKGETVSIPFSALDQFGVDVKHPTGITLTANGAGAGGSAVAATWDKNIVKDTTALNVAISPTAASNVVITGVTPSGKFVQLSFSTVDQAVPTTISSVKGVDALLVGSSKTITAANNVVIKDQYSRDIGLGAYSIKLEKSGDAATTADTSLPATFVAAKKGSLGVTLTLLKPASTTEVDNSSLTFNLKVVEKSEIASYEAAVEGTILDDGAVATYGKELKVSGILADGTKVNIPYAAGANYKVNPSVSTVTYTDVDGAVMIAAAGHFTEADKDGEAAVTVTVVTATSTQIIPVTVKISSKVSAPATLEVVGKTGVVEKVDTNYVAIDDLVINGAGGLDTLVDAAVKAVDQYGIELKDGTEPAYSVYATNLPTGDAVGTLDEGDIFTVTAVTPNGKAASFKVLVK